MLDKIKAALSSSATYILALVVAVLLFYRKTMGLEEQLQEEKENETIKADTTNVAKADGASSDATNEFERISKQYEQEHPND